VRLTNILTTEDTVYLQYTFNNVGS